MFTNSDFAKLAAAKKKSMIATAASTTADKAKNLAETAKEAVNAVIPASNKSLDDRSEKILKVYAGLEQRVESLEDATGVATIVDMEKAAKRGIGLLAQIKANKEKEEAVKEAKLEIAKDEIKRKRAPKAKPAAKEEEKPAVKEEAPKKAAPKKKRTLRLNDTPVATK